MSTDVAAVPFKAAGVPSARLTEFGRMDAAFLLLAEEHRAAYLELVAKLDAAALGRLALHLPYDERAARIVAVGCRSRTEADFLAWCSKCEPQGTRWVAVYCAAAASGAVGRWLAWLGDLERQQAQVAARMRLARGLADEKGLPSLAAALSEPKEEST